MVGKTHHRRNNCFDGMRGNRGTRNFMDGRCDVFDWNHPNFIVVFRNGLTKFVVCLMIEKSIIVFCEPAVKRDRRFFYGPNEKKSS